MRGREGGEGSFGRGVGVGLELMKEGFIEVYVLLCFLVIVLILVRMVRIWLVFIRFGVLFGGFLDCLEIMEINISKYVLVVFFIIVLIFSYNLGVLSI